MAWLGYVFGTLLVGGLAYAISHRTPQASSSPPPLDTTAGRGHAPKEWTAADYRSLNAIANDVRASGPDLMLVQYAENRMNPRARFPQNDAAGRSLATGIGSFTKASDGITGLSEDERDAITTKSVAEQLPYVRRYFEGQQWTRLGRPYASAGVVYAMEFLPARALSRGVAPLTTLGTVAEFPLDKILADAEGNYNVHQLNVVLKRMSREPRYLGALQAMRDAVGDQSLSPRFA